MKIEVIKPKEEVKWDFPCKGIRKCDGLIVGFETYGTGTILEDNKKESNLFYHSIDWDMSEFEPLLEEKSFSENREINQKIDWDKITLPIWTKDADKDTILIYNIDGRRVTYLIISEQYIRYTYEGTFDCISDRNEWLNSLEILPNGTKIEITI